MATEGGAERATSFTVREQDIVAHLASSVEETKALEMLLLPDENDNIGGGKGKKLSKNEMQAAMTDILFRIVTGQRQMVLLFDDVQWMDVSSWALLEALFQRLCDAGCRVLACFSQRPSYDEAVVDATKTKRLMNQFHHTSEIMLTEMNEIDTHNLIGDILGLHSTEVNSELLRMIWDKTKGSPLFIRMLLAWLEESGKLKRNEAGQLVLTCPISDIKMPNGVKDSILIRIDGLPPQCREFLKAASCVGVTFDMTLVQGALGWDWPQIKAAVKDLVAKDILKASNIAVKDEDDAQTIAAVWGQISFMEVCNTLLLESQRKMIHLSVATQMEQQVKAGHNYPLDTLAHHWERTGNTERAVLYLEKAGKKSEDVFALSEAANYYKRALVCVGQLPDDAPTEVLSAEAGGEEGEEDGGEEGEEDGGEEGGVIADIDTFFDSINTPAQCSFDTFGTDADPYTIEEDPLYVARVDLDLW